MPKNSSSKRNYKLLEEHQLAAIYQWAYENFNNPTGFMEAFFGDEDTFEVWIPDQQQKLASKDATDDHHKSAIKSGDKSIIFKLNKPTNNLNYIYFQKSQGGRSGSKHPRIFQLTELPIKEQPHFILNTGIASIHYTKIRYAIFKKFIEDSRILQTRTLLFSKTQERIEEMDLKPNEHQSSFELDLPQIQKDKLILEGVIGQNIDIYNLRYKIFIFSYLVNENKIFLISPNQKSRRKIANELLNGKAKILLNGYNEKHPFFDLFEDAIKSSQKPTLFLFQKSLFYPVKKLIGKELNKKLEDEIKDRIDLIIKISKNITHTKQQAPIRKEFVNPSIEKLPETIIDYSNPFGSTHRIESMVKASQKNHSKGKSKIAKNKKRKKPVHDSDGELKKDAVALTSSKKRITLSPGVKKIIIDAISQQKKNPDLKNRTPSDVNASEQHNEKKESNQNKPKEIKNPSEINYASDKIHDERKPNVVELENLGKSTDGSPQRKKQRREHEPGKQQSETKLENPLDKPIPRKKPRQNP